MYYLSAYLGMAPSEQLPAGRDREMMTSTGPCVTVYFGRASGSSMFQSWPVQLLTADV